MPINLTQAQKLQELGVRIKSLKVWGVMNEDYRGKPRIADTWTDTGIYDNTYSAYNAEELLTMLDRKFTIAPYGDNEWMCSSIGRIHCGANLTEALGNKLIHDIENGIVLVEEINK